MPVHRDLGAFRASKYVKLLTKDELAGRAKFLMQLSPTGRDTLPPMYPPEEEFALQFIRSMVDLIDILVSFHFFAPAPMAGHLYPPKEELA